MNPFQIIPHKKKFELWLDNGVDKECFGRYNTYEEAEEKMEDYLIWYEAEIF